MPIICFEGASAVGKTTTANRFKTICGAFVVPEVNLLFVRPRNESPEWYFERQVERWQIAQEQSKSYRLVILDGDPFQPFWYCWAYNFVGWQSLDFMERFYQSKIQNKTLDFPDRYFIFSIMEAELIKRKESDVTRRRRAFETHMRMIEPQRRYFQAMQSFSLNKVRFVKAETVEGNVEVIQKNVSNLANSGEGEAKILFSKMVGWLQQNEA
jgi:hypothetical protein